MAVYSTFSGGLSAPKNYSTHSILDVRQAVIEDDSEQRRFSNAGLNRSQHITEGITEITDVSDDEDAESTSFAVQWS